MFDNIVANNEINFNKLEQKIFKFVCELGCNILKNIIERYDEKLQNERDKKAFRHRGLKPDSIKTVMGVVECHWGRFCLTQTLKINNRSLLKDNGINSFDLPHA